MAIKIPKFKPLAQSSDKTKKVLKPVLGVILVLLLGAFGLEVNNKDWDVGRILKGDAISETEVLRDEKGNLQRDANGNVITRIMRDLEGNIVSSGGKYTDEYNCDDFKTQPAAQKFFKAAGGPSVDTNRLDGDKDGIACEHLPQK